MWVNNKQEIHLISPISPQMLLCKQEYRDLLTQAFMIIYKTDPHDMT